MRRCAGPTHAQVRNAPSNRFCSSACLKSAKWYEEVALEARIGKELEPLGELVASTQRRAEQPLNSELVATRLAGLTIHERPTGEPTLPVEDEDETSESDNGDVFEGDREQILEALKLRDELREAGELS